MNNAITLPADVTPIDHDWRVSDTEAREGRLSGAPVLALFWGTDRRELDGELWQFDKGELTAARPWGDGFIIEDRSRRAYVSAMAYRWACAQTGATPVDRGMIDAAPDLLAALKAVRQFVEDEAENRGLAGSDMTDYQDEAVQALDVIDAAIAKAEGRS